MNIVVCVKWTISTDSTIKIESGTMKDRGLYHVVNPYDLIAVEEAVRLKERQPGSEVILVCAGSPSAEQGLRRCLALGADKGIILWDTAFEHSDGYATAKILARAIERLDYDLVLCGQKAADTEDEQVWAVLAEFLNIPMISACVKTDIANGCEVTVHRKLQKGNREIVVTNTPVLLAVELGLNKPRYPTLHAVLNAQRKKIQEYNLSALGLTPEEVGTMGSKTRRTALTPPRPRPKKLFTPDSSLSAAERMRLIMTGGVKQKQSNLLEGDPKYLASNLARFLDEQNFLPTVK
jgi:electron transfer flavoprotein beta subunit